VCAGRTRHRVAPGQRGPTPSPSSGSDATNYRDRYVMVTPLPIAHQRPGCGIAIVWLSDIFTILQNILLLLVLAGTIELAGTPPDRLPSRYRSNCPGVSISGDTARSGTGSRREPRTVATSASTACERRSCDRCDLPKLRDKPSKPSNPQTVVEYSLAASVFRAPAGSSILSRTGTGSGEITEKNYTSKYDISAASSGFLVSPGRGCPGGRRFPLLGGGPVAP
jgi:hypothetical protein